MKQHRSLGSLKRAAAAVACLIPLAGLAQTLELTLTNNVLQESAGRLTHWAALDVQPCPTQSITVTLSVSDTSELWVTNTITVTSDQCRVQFDLLPIWDTIVDGAQQLTLTASATDYSPAIASIDVLHAGGAERELHLKTHALLEEFVPSQAFAALPGPATINFSACLLREELNEVHILLNRSGTTYPSIQVYQTNGTYRRQVQLPQFDDAEGFCIVDPVSNVYAIIEEGSVDRITLLTITTNDTSVSRNTGSSYALTLPFGKVFNKGLEGVVYDSLNDCYYAIQEQTPMGVYRVVLGPSNATLDVLFDAETVFSGIATDLSDISLDPVSGHLLILSDESNLIIECGLDGTIHSKRGVIATQPEGLYFTSDRKTLYITGEDSELQRLDRQAPSRTVQEGSNLVFDVGLSFPSDTPVDFAILTTGHTATAFVDFLPITNTLTFMPGETCQTLMIPVLVTTSTLERTEQFNVSLTSLSSNTVSGAAYELWGQIPGDLMSLLVNSQYGTAAPAHGPQLVTFGDNIILSVIDSPVELSGSTQYVCTGWVGTGSVPENGNGVQTVTLQITNESSITWLWSTNYWLGTSSTEGGTVNGGNQWLPPGSTGQVEAVSQAFYSLQNWTGDVPPGEETNTMLRIVLDTPKFLNAVFFSQVSSNNVPYGWIATYYSATNDFEELIQLDTDGDGHTTAQEYLADTSPIDPNDVLHFLTIRTINSPRRAQVQFKGSSKRRFDVYRHVTLSETTTVTHIGGRLGRNDVTIQYTDQTPLMDRAFYSLEARLP